MSHYKERAEKDCLNCGTIVEGRFCQKCGQENIIARESFWSLLTHFVYDITHFDSKFFGSMRHLLTKPGKLSLEYIQGKRSSYLHPIRMYVFTSAFFFIIFFTNYDLSSIGSSDEDIRKEKLENLTLARTVITEKPLLSSDSLERQTARKVLAELEKDIAKIETETRLEAEKDSLKQIQRANRKDSLKLNDLKVRVKEIDEDSPKVKIDLTADSTNDAFSSLNYQSVEAYRRMQEAFPKEKRDGWIKKAFTTKIIAAAEQGKLKGEKEFLKAFLNNLFHSFPKMLFVSLPLFAVFLSWLYGRRKQLAYSDHAIFTIHTYCAVFIFLLGAFALSALQEKTGWGILNLFQGLISIAIFLYVYKAMRRFYGDGRGKTILKFILLNMLSLFMMTILLVIFTAISAAQTGNAAH